MRSLPVRIVPARRSIQALPAEGRPGPSDYDDDDDHDDDHDDHDDNDDGADGGDGDGDEEEEEEDDDLMEPKYEAIVSDRTYFS